MKTNLVSVYEVACKCGKIERLFHTLRASEKHLHHLGWKRNWDHVWRCPDCIEKAVEARRKNIEVITVTETMFEGRVFTDEDRS